MFTGRDNSAPLAAETTDMLAAKNKAANVYFFIMLDFKKLRRKYFRLLTQN
jgi:hypothetical protein